MSDSLADLVAMVRHDGHRPLRRAAEGSNHPHRPACQKTQQPLCSPPGMLPTAAGKPVAFKLMPQHTPLLLAAPDSSIAKRGAFATKVQTLATLFRGRPWPAACRTCCRACSHLHPDWVAARMHRLACHWLCSAARQLTMQHRGGTCPTPPRLCISPLPAAPVGDAAQ